MPQMYSLNIYMKTKKWESVHEAATQSKQLCNRLPFFATNHVYVENQSMTAMTVEETQ